METLNAPAISGPDFIGIGAARSGTTWLYSVLRKHPEVFMTDVKELQYFYWSYTMPESDLKSRFVEAKRAVLPGRVQAVLLDRFYHAQRARNLLLRGQPNHEWYLRLHDKKGRRGVSGEITPSYATLSPEVVQEMANLVPNAKLIFTMRDPVERIWSHCRYWMKKGVWHTGDVENVLHEHFLLRTQYDTTIDTYERFFPRTQILYSYYEEMVSDPRGYVDRVCRFLGISPLPENLDHALGERVNSAADMQIPTDVKSAIEKRLDGLVDRVEDRVGYVPGAWRR